MNDMVSAALAHPSALPHMHDGGAHAWAIAAGALAIIVAVAVFWRIARVGATSKPDVRSKETRRALRR